MECCKKCGKVCAELSDFTITPQGNQLRGDCISCGKFVAWIPKADKYGTTYQRESIWDKTICRCAYCGIRVNPNAKNSHHYDHIEPQSKVIDNDVENLYLACTHCNTQKGKKSIKEYRDYLKNKFKKPTFVFFFEILQFSDFGERLKLFYALETKTHLTTDENKLS